MGLLNIFMKLKKGYSQIKLLFYHYVTKLSQITFIYQNILV